MRATWYGSTIEEIDRYGENKQFYSVPEAYQDEWHKGVLRAVYCKTDERVFPSVLGRLMTIFVNRSSLRQAASSIHKGE
jgi:hypothetical protein